MKVMKFKSKMIIYEKKNLEKVFPYKYIIIDIHPRLDNRVITSEKG